LREKSSKWRKAGLGTGGGALLHLLPLEERKNIPMASVAFDIEIEQLLRDAK
jgi:hypothetical protein